MQLSKSDWRVVFLLVIRRVQEIQGRAYLQKAYELPKRVGKYGRRRRCTRCRFMTIVRCHLPAGVNIRPYQVLSKVPLFDMHIVMCRFLMYLANSQALVAFQRTSSMGVVCPLSLCCANTQVSQFAPTATVKGAEPRSANSAQEMRRMCTLIGLSERARL